jgi:PhnB protein
MVDHEAQGPMTGVTPHLTIADGRAKEAVAFYAGAFGAEAAMEPMLAEDGVRVMHAHLRINGGSLMLNDDFPEYQPSQGSGGPITLHLQVDDTDAWFDRAVAAGCTPAMPPADMFWGDRYGQVVDPFGQTWAFGSPISEEK